MSARIPYTAIPAMLRAQRSALDARIRTLSRSHIVHPGLPAFAAGARATRVHIAHIPGPSPLPLPKRPPLSPPPPPPCQPRTRLTMPGSDWVWHKVGRVS